MRLYLNTTARVEVQPTCAAGARNFDIDFRENESCLTVSLTLSQLEALSDKARKVLREQLEDAA